jgi:hypothetical protein
MLNTALAVSGLVAWYLLLLLIIWSSRVYLSVVEGRPANGFANDGSDVGPFSERLCRAHANMYEGAPYLLGPLLLALAIDQAHVTEGLALWFLACRVLQSTVHLLSTSNLAVQARFAFFFVQFGIACYFVFAIVSSLLYSA